MLYHTYFVARRALERIQSTKQCPVDPGAEAMMGWTMLHGFCSLLLSGTLQPAEGLSTEQLKRVFLSMYAHGPEHG